MQSTNANAASFETSYLPSSHQLSASRLQRTAGKNGRTTSGLDKLAARMAHKEEDLPALAK